MGNQTKVIKVYIPLWKQHQGQVRLTVVTVHRRWDRSHELKKYKRAPSSAYKISKAALYMLNAQYALDHAEAGFTFVCVSPGVSIFFRQG